MKIYQSIKNAIFPGQDCHARANEERAYRKVSPNQEYRDCVYFPYIKT
jgi:hypothetical protein